MLEATTTALYPYQSHYSMWLTNRIVVVHAHVASLESFKAKVWGESLRGQTTLTLRSKANKNNNHFNFFSSPRPKSMIDCNLEDRPHHQRHHKDPDTKV